MALAIFDLDNTLIEGDSDYLWGQFLVKEGKVDAGYYARENARFYEEYRRGTLDIQEFLQFALAPFSKIARSSLEELRIRFMKEQIQLLPAACTLIERHRTAGDRLLILTASNRFIATPIAAAFGIETLIATELEEKNGQYTGKVFGTPCFQVGKVIRLREWMKEHNSTLTGSWFYTDSHNDFPLLEQVTHPVAVDPDRILFDTAKKRSWQIISLRSGQIPLAL